MAAFVLGRMGSRSSRPCKRLVEWRSRGKKESDQLFWVLVHSKACTDTCCCSLVQVLETLYLGPPSWCKNKNWALSWAFDISWERRWYIWLWSRCLIWAPFQALNFWSLAVNGLFCTLQSTWKVQTSESCSYESLKLLWGSVVSISTDDCLCYEIADCKLVTAQSNFFSPCTYTSFSTCWYSHSQPVSFVEFYRAKMLATMNLFPSLGKCALSGIASISRDHLVCSRRCQGCRSSCEKRCWEHV